MPGHKGFTRQEIDAGRNWVDAALSAHVALVDAVEDEAPDGTIETTLQDFDPLYFDGLALALDRRYASRERGAGSKGSGALGELDRLVESIIRNDSDRARLTTEQFERLADAVFAELEKDSLG